MTLRAWNFTLGSIAEVIARCAEEEGFAVRHAADLASAREMLASGVDLLVVDQILTDGGGLDLLSERSAQMGPPALVISALAGNDHRIFGLDAGANDYITSLSSRRS